jgi:hypothetical protein
MTQSVTSGKTLPKNGDCAVHGRSTRQVEVDAFVRRHFAWQGVCVFMELPSVSICCALL